MKKILIGVLLIALIFALTACNRQMIDITYKFDRAIVALPTGIIVEGKVDSWKDFEDGDQIQVKIEGKTYLTHASNVILIAN